MLDKIVNSPFRILGVYANARPAEIVSNCDEMEAYLSVDQNVAFDLDLDNLMPHVVRSADSVSNAKKLINLPIDKLKYALFWFVKDSSSTHALNYLKNGDFNNIYDVLDIDDSFSSMVNKSVTGILHDNDLGFAIGNITKLIHNDDLRNNFVKTICGEAFSITEEDLAHLYIESLLEEVDASELFELFEENGVSEDDNEYLRTKVIDEPISRINAEIVKAKSMRRNDADANYIAGKALMNNTKWDLAKVKTLLGATDIKYQMIADELANTILQCGINYFNNTDDDDDIDKAMLLQKYACEIAVGKMCKDRCNQNLAILEKKKEEEAVGADVLFIANQLKVFQTESHTIENARNLVNNCKPHLASIKNQLGSQNDTYLQISSAVANNALGMIVTVINNAQNTLTSPYSYSSPLTNIVNLKSKVDSAINVMNLIGGLDMTSAERNHYNTNKSSLYNIKSQVDSETSSIPNRTISSASSTPSSPSGENNTNRGCVIWVIVALAVGAVWGGSVGSWECFFSGLFIVFAIYFMVR
ncbi:MAG: hypothetical protein K6F40_02800 [Bacteroidales bacterium]|nr:hypothetical protein [Bacteroidales bacterium]